jgi:multidrug efflux pump subunit AcrB
MPGFSIRNPYFIIVICLVLLVIGVTSIARMPVDLFPPINLPEVVVATFYSGMPPEDIETISRIPWSASLPWPPGSITWNPDPCWA